jgi:hypothetical protein
VGCHDPELFPEPDVIATEVSIADPDRRFFLHTDWSVQGMGAVLAQRDDDGREYMVACISRSNNEHERNYSSYTGELLAVVWACKTLRPYLHGVEFTVITDHQPLVAYERQGPGRQVRALADDAPGVHQHC